MAKKFIFWAMLVMVLAFGMTVVGCEEEEERRVQYVANVIVKNDTDAKIEMVRIETFSAMMNAKVDEGSLSRKDAIEIDANENKTYNIAWEGNSGHTSLKAKVSLWWYFVDSTYDEDWLASFTGNIDVRHGEIVNFNFSESNKEACEY